MSSYEDELKAEIESLKKKNAELELLLKTPTTVGVDIDYSMEAIDCLEICDTLGIFPGNYGQPKWASRETPLPYYVAVVKTLDEDNCPDEVDYVMVLTKDEAVELLANSSKPV